MNIYEARIELARRISDLLLGFYEDPSEDDVDGARDVAEVLVDGLGLEVVEVTDGVAICNVDLNA